MGLTPMLARLFTRGSSLPAHDGSRGDRRLTARLRLPAGIGAVVAALIGVAGFVGLNGAQSFTVPDWCGGVRPCPPPCLGAPEVASEPEAFVKLARVELGGDPRRAFPRWTPPHRALAHPLYHPRWRPPASAQWQAPPAVALAP